MAKMRRSRRRSARAAARSRDWCSFPTARQSSARRRCTTGSPNFKSAISRPAVIVYRPVHGQCRYLASSPSTAVAVTIGQTPTIPCCHPHQVRLTRRDRPWRSWRRSRRITMPRRQAARRRTPPRTGEPVGRDVRPRRAGWLRRTGWLGRAGRTTIQRAAARGQRHLPIHRRQRHDRAPRWHCRPAQQRAGRTRPQRGDPCRLPSGAGISAVYTPTPATAIMRAAVRRRSRRRSVRAFRSPALRATVRSRNGKLSDVLDYVGPGRSSTSTAVPTGTVSFYDATTGQALSGSPVTLPTATTNPVTARFSTTFTTSGLHLVIATYSGDSNTPAKR